MVKEAYQYPNGWISVISATVPQSCFQQGKLLGHTIKQISHLSLASAGLPVPVGPAVKCSRDEDREHVQVFLKPPIPARWGHSTWKRTTNSYIAVLISDGFDKQQKESDVDGVGVRNVIDVSFQILVSLSLEDF